MCNFTLCFSAAEYTFPGCSWTGSTLRFCATLPYQPPPSALWEAYPPSLLPNAQPPTWPPFPSQAPTTTSSHSSTSQETSSHNLLQSLSSDSSWEQPSIEVIRSRLQIKLCKILQFSIHYLASPSSSGELFQEVHIPS